MEQPKSEQPQPNPESDAKIDQPDTRPDPNADDDNPMLWCPVCSTHLEALKCKLFCRACGYYMSCADYY